MSAPPVRKENDNPHAPPWARLGIGRVVGLLVFFGIFFGGLFLFNLYVLTRLFSMLGLRHGWPFIAFTVVSSLSFVAAMGLRNARSCALTKGYYLASATWLGFLIYLLFATIAYDVLGWFVDFDSSVLAPLMVAATGALVAVSLCIPRFVIMREVEIPTPKLERPLRIVHISDVHIGAAHGPESLGKIVRMTNSAKPDLVLITGDLADSPLDPAENPFAALDSLDAPAYFTIGNHEYYAGVEGVIALLAKTKVRVLRNEAVDVDRVQIVGADYGGVRELKAALDGLTIDRSKHSILMFHQPDGMEEARAAGVDLMLCGHTHGGQFFPFTVINRLIWGSEYLGLHERGGMFVYTSAGAGTWGPPMRLGTRSEITLITVMPIKGKA